MPPPATSFRLAPFASDLPHEDAAARRLLDVRRLRHTVARSAVLAAALRLGGTAEPITAQSLHHDLNARGRFIGLPTIYRVLGALQAAGLLHAMPPAEAAHAAPGGEARTGRAKA